jgi:hypothetical protein
MSDPARIATSRSMADNQAHGNLPAQAVEQARVFYAERFGSDA